MVSNRFKYGKNNVKSINNGNVATLTIINKWLKTNVQNIYFIQCKSLVNSTPLHPPYEPRVFRQDPTNLFGATATMHLCLRVNEQLISCFKGYSI